jgi:plasmid maintenance system killer protein
LKDTQRLFEDESCPRCRSIERQARRKPEVLEAATSLNELAKVPEIVLRRSREIESGGSALTINGAYASNGRTAMPSMWKSKIIIEPDCDGI